MNNELGNNKKILYMDTMEEVIQKCANNIVCRRRLSCTNVLFVLEAQRPFQPVPEHP